MLQWTILNEIIHDGSPNRKRDLVVQKWRERVAGDLQIVPCFEHRDVKSYNVEKKNGMVAKELERGFQ